MQTGTGIETDMDRKRDTDGQRQGPDGQTGTRTQMDGQGHRRTGTGIGTQADRDSDGQGHRRTGAGTQRDRGRDTNGQGKGHRHRQLYRTAYKKIRAVKVLSFNKFYKIEF
jgi:hypothetical protein